MIVDIISSSIDVAGEAQFTATDAALEVAVSGPGADGLVFSNSYGMSYFQLGDNLKIAKLWVNIPFGFGQGTGLHTIGLGYWDGSTFELITPPFQNSSNSVGIPTLCGPLEFAPDGLFATMPKTGVRRQIRLVDMDLNVSMLNLPADLVGQIIKVQYHLEVLHSLPMMAGA